MTQYYVSPRIRREARERALDRQLERQMNREQSVSRIASSVAENANIGPGDIQGIRRSLGGGSTQTRKPKQPTNPLSWARNTPEGKDWAADFNRARTARYRQGVASGDITPSATIGVRDPDTGESREYSFKGQELVERRAGRLRNQQQADKTAGLIAEGVANDIRGRDALGMDQMYAGPDEGDYGKIAREILGGAPATEASEPADIEVGRRMAREYTMPGTELDIPVEDAISLQENPASVRRGIDTRRELFNQAFARTGDTGRATRDMLAGMREQMSPEDIAALSDFDQYVKTGGPGKAVLPSGRTVTIPASDKEADARLSRMTEQTYTAPGSIPAVEDPYVAMQRSARPEPDMAGGAFGTPRADAQDEYARSQAALTQQELSQPTAKQIGAIGSLQPLDMHSETESYAGPLSWLWGGTSSNATRAVDERQKLINTALGGNPVQSRKAAQRLIKEPFMQRLDDEIAWLERQAKLGGDASVQMGITRGDMKSLAGRLRAMRMQVYQAAGQEPPESQRRGA